MKLPSTSKRKRPLRIAAEIGRDIPDILRKHVPMPPGVMVNITDVEVSDDLSFAKIYFSILGDQSETRIVEVTKYLNHHKGTMRHELAQRLIMRQHPDLRFIYDATPARAARIEELLKSVKTDPSVENEPES
jgi:ribosome-binding factor A